jgi:hypothetical protein
MVDQYHDYVKLLLPMNGSNNSTEFINYSKFGINEISSYNNPIISSNQYKYYNSSAYFDGSSSLIVPSYNIFNLTNHDFTIEFWLYRINTGVRHELFTKRDSSNYAQAYIYIQNGINVRALSSVGGGWQIDMSSTTSILANTWYHIAYERYGSIFSLYINGIKEASVERSNSNLLVGSNPIYISGNQYDGFYLNGYINDVRMTIGIARYKKNFIPPDKLISQISGCAKYRSDYPSRKVSVFNNSNTLLNSTTPDELGNYSLYVPSVGPVYITSYPINVETAVGSWKSNTVYKLKDIIYPPNIDKDSFIYEVSSVSNDPLYSNVSLLLNGLVFNDLSLISNSVYRNSNVSVTSNLSRNCYSNAYSGQSGSYIIDNNLLNFKSNNFTVECWFCLGSSTSFTYEYNYGVLITNGKYGTTSSNLNDSFDIGIYNTGQLVVSLYAEDNTSASLDYTLTPSEWSAQWRHIAVVRNNSIFTLYIDGTSVGSTVFNKNLSDISWNDVVVGIGAGYLNKSSIGSPRCSLKCFYYDMRVTNKIARYTSNFTPVNMIELDKSGLTEPTWDSNEGHLTVDNSITWKCLGKIERLSPITNLYSTE